MQEKTTLRVGLIGEAINTVTSQQSAVSMGSGSLEVYSTPALIAQLEAATVAAVDPYLRKGYTSVGVDIKIRHLSATPIGEYVTAMAEITRIDGKRVELQVRAWDEHELIGEGTIIRYVIDAEEFLSRLDRPGSSA
jgi:predicted thioesterase